MQRKQHGSIVFTAKINKLTRLVSSALRIGFLFGSITAAFFVHLTSDSGLFGFWNLIKGWLDFRVLAAVFPIPRRLLGTRELWQMDWDESQGYRLWVLLIFFFVRRARRFYPQQNPTSAWRKSS